MRFLHSFLYSLVVWAGAVVFGSFLGYVFAMAINDDRPNDLLMGDGYGTIGLMIVFSAIFSIPAFIVLNVVIVSMNPLLKSRVLPIKLVLTAVSVVMSLLCIGFFLRGELGSGDGEFLRLTMGYPVAAILFSWVYPIQVFAKRTQPQASLAHVTVQQYQLPEEKAWFETQAEERR